MNRTENYCLKRLYFLSFGWNLKFFFAGVLICKHIEVMCIFEQIILCL